MSRVEAESFAGVKLMRRSRMAEASARAALLETVGRFSPRVEDAGEDAVAVCVADVAGTERLFGSAEELGGKMREAVAELGLECGVVVCGDFHTAVAVARETRGVAVIAAGGELAALADLPLSVLAVPDDKRETLALWGIRTVGGLAALPEVELITRMGQEGKRLRAMARGEWPHLFRAVEEEFALAEGVEFDASVEDVETLLFCLGPMLDQMLVRARGRAMALASVTVTMVLDGEGVHTRTVRPALPTEDRKLLLKLLHLDFGAHPPDKAVAGLRVTAEAGGTSKVQMGLFAPQLPEASRLDVTLARLLAIVGDGRVGSPVRRDTHEPGRVCDGGIPYRDRDAGRNGAGAVSAADAAAGGALAARGGGAAGELCVSRPGVSGGAGLWSVEGVGRLVECVAVGT